MAQHLHNHAAQQGYRMPFNMPLVPSPFDHPGYGFASSHGRQGGTPMRTPTRPMVQGHGTTPSNHSAGSHTPRTVAPDKYCKRLERELSEGSKEELIEILLELSAQNKEAAAFIDCKAQLFHLRAESNHDVTMPHDASYATQTPVKAEGSVITGTPTTPLNDLRNEIHDGHFTSLTRKWSAELHPCHRMFGNCRYPSSCPFAKCPANLCLAYVRGECRYGNDCPHVHRCPPAVTHNEKLKHLFELLAEKQGKENLGTPQA